MDFAMVLPIGYRGRDERQTQANNLPFQVGNKFELWEKKSWRKSSCHILLGPVDEIPFDNFIQSPIGLAPKGGNETRLIFHLSHPQRDSVNSKHSKRAMFSAV